MRDYRKKKVNVVCEPYGESPIKKGLRCWIETMTCWRLKVEVGSWDKIKRSSVIHPD